MDNVSCSMIIQVSLPHVSLICFIALSYNKEIQCMWGSCSKHILLIKISVKTMYFCLSEVIDD